MRKLSIGLCLVTLVAVILDVTLFHSRTANAQSGTSGTRVTVERVTFGGGNSGSARVDGKVVGFTCVDIGGTPQCFVASGWVATSENK
jgi:hypothetical protein